jgi:hypothetical protein
MAAPRSSLLNALSLGILLAAAGCTKVPPSAGSEAGGQAEAPALAARERPAEAKAKAQGSDAVANEGESEREPRGERGAKAVTRGQPVAVVELFTSEGCSSCPPADDLFRQMAAEARAQSKAVFFLSFHVDYWNELGWPDPFSSRVFTDRQYAYARVFGTQGAYTPQMVVGGRSGFVGSDAARARKSVEEALAASASVEVSLRAKAAGGAGVAEVSYAAAGAPKGAVLNVALVEDGIVVRVPRGENAGRTLSHDGVVRVFRTLSLDRAREGSLSIGIPAGVSRERASFVAYAQDAETLSVLGAVSAPIEP